MQDMDDNLPPIRLSNPYKADQQNSQITLVCRVPPNVQRYFFAHVLAGGRGAMQAVLGTLLDKLYRECLARKIPACFDENGPEIIAKVLSELNFNVQPINRPAPPRRRSPISTPKRKGKPDAPGSE